MFALECFAADGWNGIWSENAYWAEVMVLLFWDIYWMPVPGQWNTPRAPFDDMPHDLFGKGFYERRQRHIVTRLGQIAARLDVAKVMRGILHGHRGEGCRPVENWDAFTDNELTAAAVLPRQLLVSIMRRLLEDFNEHRSGWPDLYLWDRDGAVLFAEVKAEGDELRPNQVDTIEFLEGSGAQVTLVHVREDG
jgi:Fanconi-associated nuclease 1